MEKKFAYSIEELVKSGPVGRTSLYKAIKDKQLVARKSGRRTIILLSDYERYLDGLPVVDRDAAGEAA